jgi:hypothetical protein
MEAGRFPFGFAVFAGKLRIESLSPPLALNAASLHLPFKFLTGFFLLLGVFLISPYQFRSGAAKLPNIQPAAGGSTARDRLDFCAVHLPPIAH